MTVLYKTIKQAAAETGYSEHAIRSKIRDGIWGEGLVWIKAPDGRILISIQGYNTWVESELASEHDHKPVSRSHSTTRAGAVGRPSRSSPPPLI